VDRFDQKLNAVEDLRASILGFIQVITSDFKSQLYQFGYIIRQLKGFGMT